MRAGRAHRSGGTEYRRTGRRRCAHQRRKTAALCAREYQRRDRRRSTIPRRGENRRRNRFAAFVQLESNLVARAIAKRGKVVAIAFDDRGRLLAHRDKYSSPVPRRTRTAAAGVPLTTADRKNLRRYLGAEKFWRGSCRANFARERWGSKIAVIHRS